MLIIKLHFHDMSNLVKKKKKKLAYQQIDINFFYITCLLKIISYWYVKCVGLIWFLRAQKARSLGLGYISPLQLIVQRWEGRPTRGFLGLLSKLG